MDNKYYRASAEDFQLGLDYEVWRSWAYSPEKWDKHTFNLQDESGTYYSHLGEELIMCHDGCDGFRIKYLDKEDIESLGWQYVGNDIFGMNEFRIGIKDDTAFDGYYNKYWELVKMQHNRYFIQYNESGGFAGGTNYYKVPEIEIKNKSELKKLMSQLNINA